MDTSDVLLLIQARRASKSGVAAMIRHRARLSQAELGSVIGVTAPAVSRWETGERRPVGAAALRYARLLDTLARQTGVEEWGDGIPETREAGFPASEPRADAIVDGNVS